MAPPLTAEVAHALDAPFDVFDVWFDELTFGICTACGCDAYAGRNGWWHETTRLCSDGKLQPSFAPD
jgi:hypothetical protein